MRALLLAAVCSLALPGAVGCADSCDNVNCGAGGVYVIWRDGQIEPADLYRVCADGICADVEPEPYQFEPDESAEDGRVVFLERSVPERAQVSLTALRSNGNVVARYDGEGIESEGCCPAMYLEATEGKLNARE